MDHVRWQREDPNLPSRPSGGSSPLARRNGLSARRHCSRRPSPAAAPSPNASQRPSPGPWSRPACESPSLSQTLGRTRHAPILMALVRSATTSEAAASMLLEILGTRVREQEGPSFDAERLRRVALAASNLFDLAIARHHQVPPDRPDGPRHTRRRGRTHTPALPLRRRGVATRIVGRGDSTGHPRSVETARAPHESRKNLHRIERTGVLKSPITVNFVGRTDLNP